ncbi:MAG: hypothetical protein QXU32_13345 [Nitrososphaerales archaeon]
MKIALDLDGVLADIVLVWINQYNRKHNASINKETIESWDFWKDLGVGKYEFYYQLSNCWSRWKEVPPMENDIDNAVNKLHALGTVDIVTARDQESTNYVLEWLEHNKIIYNEYVVVQDGREKANLDYDMFIDDSPHNAIRLASRSKNVLLYDQPWNKLVKDPTIVRIKKLVEAVEIISNSNTKLGEQYKMQNFLE